MFDPAVFYGHYEYDIASVRVYDSSNFFYDSYFNKIPKAIGYENRLTLYLLFHQLNNWYVIFSN